MEEEALDRAPIWDDLSTFDCEPYRGLVDLVSAGFPCQPFSYAGKQRGSDDERWLWPDVARVVREIRPSLVFLENVPGLLAHGLGDVLGDLAACGYDAEWDVFRASDVGAPHLRERIFVLAWRVSDAVRDALRDEPERRQGPASASERGDSGSRPMGEGMADAGLGRRSQGLEPEAGRGPDARERSSRLADPDGARRETTGGGAVVDAGSEPQAGGDPVADSDRGRRRSQGLERESAGRSEAADRAMGDSEHERLGELREGDDGPGATDARREIPDGRYSALDDADREGPEGWSGEGFGGAYEQPPWPPGPADRAGWEAYIAEGGPQPAVRGGPDGIPDRVDRLQALGNAVVPMAAAVAFRVLAMRAVGD